MLFGWHTGHSNLEPLRLQLDVLERMGFDRTCFWHWDDDPAIAQNSAYLRELLCFVLVAK